LNIELREVNETAMNKMIELVNLEKLKIFVINTEVELRFVMKLVASYKHLKELRVRFASFVDL
jgi:hypothetical protein